MVARLHKGKNYDVDEQGFLLNFNQWDEDFATSMATKCGLSEGLLEKHWAVIRFIRDSFHKKGKCPLVYETCRANNLTWSGLRDLFPTGYLRGACLLAGITYQARIVNYYGEPEHILPAIKSEVKPREKTYLVDVDGFLINPSEWDEQYAARKADELEIRGGLTGKHWQIIHFLRESYEMKGFVPTVYECCESNGLELDDLAELFPSGYHRGAVKISGLRVR
ncbi:MAG: TusE/DsrC/DsvC family sulfur relay protein [Dehalococcoidia bacterium]|nr:MAG: TusE/DsrC/DsvC family sulfur relay protein [Dehalococcoidia bacterium]